jgi:hypothetical protein
MWRIRTGQALRELYRDLDIIADSKKKGLDVLLEWIRDEQLGKYIREAEEGEYLKRDGSKMWRRINLRRRLSDGERMQSIGKNGLS